MTEEEAREFFPVWAGSKIKPVHIIDEPELWTDAEEDEKLEWKWPFSVKVGEFWKRHMILIVAAVGFVVWTLGVCLITGAIVRKNTVEAQTHFWRGQLQIALDEQANRNMAANLLTGEASLQATIDSEAEFFARFLNGYITK